MTVRKIGLEEELMLIDPATGALTAVSQKAVRAHQQQGLDQVALGVGIASAEPGVEEELFLQQIETATPPCHQMNELAEEVRRARRVIGQAAHDAGGAAVAMPTAILVEDQANFTPKPRYQQIYEGYGELAEQSLACAMHMHVDISDQAEGIAVIDRIRPWLPVLSAISANSPYWRGRSTGYASWRAQVWTRWPSSGSAEPFGDVSTYRETADRLVEWGAALDDGMLYFDARLSEKYPTVEIRVADVCTEIEDAVLVAALGRALVETAATEHAAGVDAPVWRSDLLRAASWRASRFGTSGQLVDPQHQQLAPVRDVFASLTGYVAEALDEAGDRELVESLFERLISGGNGAIRQRRVFEKERSLEAVVMDLQQRTEQSWKPGGTWVSG